MRHSAGTTRFFLFCNSLPEGLIILIVSFFMSCCCIYVRTSIHLYFLHDIYSDFFYPKMKALSDMLKKKKRQQISQFMNTHTL